MFDCYHNSSDDDDTSWLHSEYCDCPSLELDQWIEKSHCPSGSTQLQSDLKHWPSIDFSRVHETVSKQWAGPTQKYAVALCHYQIIDNQLYRQCYGEYTGFKMFVDSVLTSLMRKMRLPNTEFIFNLGDWPLEKNLTNGVPIVSWCGSTDTLDIVVPTYELMKSVIDSMEAVAVDIHTAKGDTDLRWEQKKDTAVFRGRDSNQLRLEVAKLSQRHRDMIDAGITRYFFFNETINVAPVDAVSFAKFFEHKYVLSIDGTVAAYRFPFLLAGDSVILKAESQFYEHFYVDLQDGVHYISFDQKNLLDKLRSARTQDLSTIRTSMHQFVLDHLQPLHLYCYYANFFKYYTRRLAEPPTVRMENMEFVTKIPSNRAPTDSCGHCWNRTADAHNSKKVDL